MAQQLDSAFIDLSYKGYESIKSGMGQIKSWAKDTSDSFDKMASKATGAFASLSGTILATTRNASPQVFDLFTGSLKALSIVVGATLAPILVQFTGYIMEAISWWSNLDSGTKSLIVSFAKWGTIITGGIVVLNTLNSVFGGFTSACIKFAIANPLAAALLVVVGVVTLLMSKMDELNNKTLENIKNVDRLKSGDVNKNDMKKSWVGKDLMAIEDPAERAKAAQAIIDKETKRMNEATGRVTTKGSFGLGLSRIGQGLGINTDTAELDKVQQDAGNNIGIATAIRDKAKQGKSLDVKDACERQSKSAARSGRIV
jgi:hypothetical protein